MTTGTGPPEAVVDVERLRGETRTETARTHGRLDLVERHWHHAERALAEQRDEVSALAARVAELERRVYMAVGAATAIGTVLGILAQLLLG